MGLRLLLLQLIVAPELMAAMSELASVCVSIKTEQDALALELIIEISIGVPA